MKSDFEKEVFERGTLWVVTGGATAGCSKHNDKSLTTVQAEHDRDFIIINK